jgi:hypothetical protein
MMHGTTNVKFVTLYEWLSGMHTRQSFIQSDKYQVSHRYSCSSWWWAHSRPKHVEKRNKHTKKNCAPSWLYLKDYTRMHGQQNIKFGKLLTFKYHVIECFFLIWLMNLRQKIEFFISSTHFPIHFAAPLNVWYLAAAPPTLHHIQPRPCQGEKSPRCFLNTRLGGFQRFPGRFGEVKPLDMPEIQRESLCWAA